MNKKIINTVWLVLAVAFVFAMSVSATTAYYYDVDGSPDTPIFRCEYDDDKVITSYSGEFAKTNGAGEAISWFMTEESTDESGNIIRMVKSFVTMDPQYHTLDGNGMYKFITSTGVKKETIVSINFPNDCGVKSFSNGSQYNFVANTGAYAPDKMRLLFAYFPNTWTNVDRIVQATTVLEVYFDKGCEVTVIGDTSFYGCRSLRHVSLPLGITKINDGSGAFYNCSSLTSIELKHLPLTYIGSVAFGSSGLTSIEVPDTVTYVGNSAFAYSQLTEFSLPDSVTRVGERIVEGCSKLVKVRFPANVTNITQSITYKANNVQYYYVPNTIKEATGTHHFTTQHASYKYSVLFFAGDRAEAEAFIQLIGNKSNEKFYTTNYSNFIEWDPEMADEDYVAKAEGDKRHYVVFGYDRCQAFYGGHQMSEETEMQFTGYLEDVLFASVCVNNGCTYRGVDSSKTISPMFTWKGYSVSQYADVNGTFAVTQCFLVNKSSIEKYNEAKGTELVFGVLATGNADGIAQKPSLEGNKVLSQQLDKLIHDYFEIKVTGITEALKSTKIIFCAYVLDGGEMLYLDGTNAGTDQDPVYVGATKAETAGVSYNDISK